MAIRASLYTNNQDNCHIINKKIAFMIVILSLIIVNSQEVRLGFILKSVHIHNDLKNRCDDFICTIVYSLNVIRLIHDYTVNQ